MQFKPSTLVAVAGLLGLVACGETTLEQGIFGAGAGAGTAAVLGGNVAAGALVGGAGNVAYCRLNPERCY